MADSRIYRWISDWLQQEKTDAMRLSDFDSLRQNLLPGDIILVDGHSPLDTILRKINTSRWSRVVLYLGRLHDIKDPTLRSTVAACLHCQPDTQLIVHGRLDQGLMLAPLNVLEPEHLRICRPRGLTEHDINIVVRFVISRLGSYQSSWWTLFVLLLPWGLIRRRWRTSLFSKLSNPLLRLLVGTPIGEAFSLVQFPILPLVKRENGNQLKLYRRNPNIFIAADFDHSPYFDVVKYAFIDRIGNEKMRLMPWQGQQEETTHQLTFDDSFEEEKTLDQKIISLFKNRK